MKIISILIIFLGCALLGSIAAATSLGANWTEINSNASFSPRNSHSTAVFNDRLWVIGGDSVNGSFNDVWSSSDGRNWNLETENAGFTPRFGLGTIVFDDKLWVIGGLSNGSALNDIWSSSDGRNWTELVKNAGFSPRYFHGVSVFNHKLWVIGGSKQNGRTLNDVWSSSDGTNWTLETDNADFMSRHGAGVIEFNHRLWVIGGSTYSYDSRGDTILGRMVDVWSSGDGISWELENSSAAFEGREFVPVTTFNSKIWIIGGGIFEPRMEYLYNNVWSSSDGRNWNLETENAGFSPRWGNGAITFNNTMWIIGGRGYYNIDKNDVWQMNSPIPISNQTTTNATNEIQTTKPIPSTISKTNKAEFNIEYSDKPEKIQIQDIIDPK